MALSRTSGVSVITKRLDRIENKLDKYTEETIKLSTKMYDHLNNKNLHFSLHELKKEIKNEPCENGFLSTGLSAKMMGVIAGLVTIISTLANIVFAYVTR